MLQICREGGKTNVIYKTSAYFHVCDFAKAQNIPSGKKIKSLNGRNKNECDLPVL